MFVEGEVEIKIKDRSAQAMDEHELKLWIQRSFRDLACYRISNFTRTEAKVVRATVALKTSVLPESEKQMLESRPNDVGALRSFMERTFDGKGACRCIGDPKLRVN